LIAPTGAPHPRPRAQLPADRQPERRHPGLGHPGFAASADYVAGRLEAAGYTVSRQEFTFPFHQELQDIVANLHFDMLGSPNHVRFVYDGDGAATGTDGPPGSAQIEDPFNDYFASQGLATEPTAFDGRSDHGPFIAVGIPAGGLFSGAEGVKTAEQAAVYGGTAGEPDDPCYRQPRDDITNLGTKALFELGDGAAHAVMTLARTRTGFFEDGSFRTRRGRRLRQAPALQRSPGRRLTHPVRQADGPEAWEERPTPSKASPQSASPFRPHELVRQGDAPRLATERLHRLLGRHSMPSRSQARPEIPRMSADTLLKWYRG
jgi:Peptidase family M28